jgi:hypothetical protein
MNTVKQAQQEALSTALPCVRQPPEHEIIWTQMLFCYQIAEHYMTALISHSVIRLHITRTSALGRNNVNVILVDHGTDDKLWPFTTNLSSNKHVGATDVNLSCF